MTPKIKVLVVGQTPPPFGGQAVMIERLLRVKSDHVAFIHVRLAFSRTMDEIGSFRFGKVLHLFSVIGRIVWARLRHRPRILYYPPAGPTRLAICRDVIILLATRWMFARTVFHFHAGGLSDVVPGLSGLACRLFMAAYGRPDCTVCMSPLNPPDGEAIGSRNAVIIPYGIPDESAPYLETVERDPAKILFVGVLRASKGVMILLEAARLLKEQHVSFSIEFVGRFQSEAFERQAREFVDSHALSDVVTFGGVKTGEEKWRAYAESGIFCFPSYFESEAFSVVVLEAMMFALPVIVTEWRGLPSMVREGETGFLVPTHDPSAVRDRLLELLNDPARGNSMGKSGHTRFCEEFRIDHWQAKMEEMFIAAASGDGG